MPGKDVAFTAVQEGDPRMSESGMEMKSLSCHQKVGIRKWVARLST